VAADELFTYRELATSLTLKGGRPDCPSCGGEKWAVADDERLVFVPLLSSDGEVVVRPDGTEGFSALALVCANCGFVRLHSAEHVMRL
jgi:hypothetical protein